jgi:uncharacterized DUF497 family protein
MDRDFRWNDWNTDHIAKHGIVPKQAEQVVLRARTPWPSYEGDNRWLVRGPDQNGLYVQVVYIIDPDATIYVIHARPLTPREKRQFRRRNK